MPNIEAPVLLGREKTDYHLRPIYRNTLLRLLSMIPVLGRLFSPNLPLHMAISVQLYRGGERLHYTPASLQELLREDLEDCYSQAPTQETLMEEGGLMIAAATAIDRDNDEVVRTWHVSDSINFAFVTFGYSANSAIAESMLTECEQIVRSIRFQMLPEEPLQTGGVYSTATFGDEAYGLWKVLAHDGQAIHIRSYGAAFKSRPVESEARQDLEQLQSRQLDIGHMPISPEIFWSSNPELVFMDTITADELEGYNE